MADHGLESEFCVAGVDVAERRGLDLVVMSGDRRILARAARLTVRDLVVLVAEHNPVAVCIDSPSGWALAGQSRRAERDLRALGISAYACPTDPGDHPFYGWIRVGFEIFEALASRYPLYRGGPLAGTAAEVYPAATATMLGGRARATHESKRSFRRDVLDANGVDLPPTTIDQVDAALAALTGVVALEGASTSVGDPEEGVVLLPSRNPSALPVPPLSEQPHRRDHKVAVPVTVTQKCLCGCGALVRRRFLPGHDAKLKSRLRRAAALGDESAAHELNRLGWGETG